MFNAADWYWVVTNSKEQVFSSFARAYVSVDDRRYREWATREGTAGTPIPSYAELMDYLDEHAPASLPDDEQALRKAAAIESLAKSFEDETSELAVVTNAILMALNEKAPLEQRITKTDVATKIREKALAISLPPKDK